MLSRSTLLRIYGLTPAQFLQLLQWQDGRCACCKRKFTPRTLPAAIDHDHLTGLIRGLLCKPCNYAIGERHDKAEWFENVAEYLRNPPAIPAIGRHFTPGSPGNPRKDTE